MHFLDAKILHCFGGRAVIKKSAILIAKAAIFRAFTAVEVCSAILWIFFHGHSTTLTKFIHVVCRLKIYFSCYRMVAYRLGMSGIVSLLSHLQTRQSNQHQHHGDNPKTYDHTRFRPAFEFKMMMQRSHAEDPFAGQFERTDLQHH